MHKHEVLFAVLAGLTAAFVVSAVTNPANIPVVGTVYSTGSNIGGNLPSF